MTGVVLTLADKDLTRVITRFVDTYGPDLFPLRSTRRQDKSLTLPLTSAAIHTAFSQQKSHAPTWAELQRKSTEHRVRQLVLQVQNAQATVEGGNQGFVVLVDDENGRRMALKLSPLGDKFTPVTDERTRAYAAFKEAEKALGHAEPLVLKEPVCDAAIAFLLGSWKYSGWLWGVPYYYGSTLLKLDGRDFTNGEGRTNPGGLYQALLMQRGDCTLHDFARENGARPTLAESYAKAHMNGVSIRSADLKAAKDDDGVATRARYLLQALCAQLLSQVALLEMLCDFVHSDYHEKNAMVASLRSDPRTAARAVGPEQSLEVIVRREEGDTLYRIPTYGKLIMLIDFGRASLVLPRTEDPVAEPTRIVGEDFLQGITAHPAQCSTRAACSGGTADESTFRTMLGCKSALSNNDDVIRLIMTLYWTAGEKALLDDIFRRFHADCPGLEQLAAHCKEDYQRVGIFASSAAYARTCSLSALDLFELYGTHAGFRQAHCPERPRNDRAYVINARPKRALAEQVAKTK